MDLRFNTALIHAYKSPALQAERFTDDGISE